MLSLKIQEPINRWYLVIVYGLLGFIGSAMSLAVLGTLVYSTLHFFKTRQYRHASLPIKVFAIAGLIYFFSGALMIAGNSQDDGIVDLLITRIPFLLLLPLFFQISISERKVVIQSLGLGLLITALGIGGWVAFGFITGSHRFSGGAGNSGPFATTCAFIFALCLLYTISTNNRFSRLYFIAMVIAAIGLAASGMRLFYPYFLCAPLIVFVIYARDIKNLFTVRNAIIAVVVIAVTGLILFPFFDQRISTLLLSYHTDGLHPSASTSLGKRIAIWQCALAGIPDAPFLGWGPPDALTYMGNCTANLVGQKIEFSHFHNFALNAFMFGGIVELLAVSFLLFSVPAILLWQSWRKEIDDIQRFALTASFLVLAIYLLQGSVNLMFGHDIHDLLFIHVNVLILVLFNSAPMLFRAGDVVAVKGSAW